jgi:hypothetical protein
MTGTSPDQQVWPMADERDELLAAQYGHSEREPSYPDVELPGQSWGDKLADQMRPWTDAELDASKAPHPHVFSAYERGLFPVGEVSVIGARGREGKTTCLVGVAVALVIEHSLAGLWPMKGRSVVIYSAEDDRAQFARKIAAQRALLSLGQASEVMGRVIVPDLEADDMGPLRRLVTVADRQPISTGTDEAIIQAIEPAMQGDHPPALLIFETASTLTDTDEDNRAFAALVDCLKRIARKLRVAVALVHHTSQASDSTLADLSISTAGIRGGTALISNSRQNILLLNLGSDADPFPATDARTVLREMAAPDQPDRVTALIAMETSKGVDPAPIFFRWVQTDYGPAAVELEPPQHLAGKSWRKVREMVMAERGSRRDEAKASSREAGVDVVVRLVKELAAAGKQPTANAVSLRAGRSPTWAAPYLGQAASEGLITTVMEVVPRTRGKKAVFRPLPDSTEAQR